MNVIYTAEVSHFVKDAYNAKDQACNQSSCPTPSSSSTEETKLGALFHGRETAIAENILKIEFYGGSQLLWRYGWMPTRSRLNGLSNIREGCTQPYSQLALFIQIKDSRSSKNKTRIRHDTNLFPNLKGLLKVAWFGLVWFGLVQLKIDFL